MTDSDEVKLLPCEELSLSAAFDMGFEWAMSLRGQTMEDSRAVGRTLFSDTFALIADRLDTSDFNSFESADHGIVAAKAIIHAVLTRPPVVTDEVVERAWREGFQMARECLSEGEAFALTEDVEEDCWCDSNFRNARASMPAVVSGGGE